MSLFFDISFSFKQSATKSSYDLNFELNDSIHESVPKLTSFLKQLENLALKRIAEETEELALVEQHPKFEGRTLVMILAPK